MTKIHTFQLKDDYQIIFHPESYTLIKTHYPAGSVLHSYYQGISPIEISKQYNVALSNITQIVKKFELTLPHSLQQESMPSDENLPNFGVEIYLFTTRNCNLKCKYCYEKNWGSSHNTIFMTRELALKTIDFFEKNFSEIKSITMFGGEPFLNYDLIEYICRFLTEKGGKTPIISVITNGTVLKAVELIKKYNIWVGLSIDGPPEIHNFLRPYHNGKGSFDNLMHFLSTLRQEGLSDKIFYECTYTKKHLDMKLTPKDVRTFIEKNLGIHQGIIVPMGMGAEKINDIQNLTLAQEQFQKLQETQTIENFIEEIDMESLRIFNSLRTHSPMHYLCSIGIDHFAIDVNGDIYPCQVLLGCNELNMGNVNSFPPLYKNPKYINAKHRLSVYEKDKNSKCKTCWAKNLCKGCPASLYLEMSEFVIPADFCERQKHRIEQFLTAIVEIRENKNLLNRMIKKIKKINKFKKKLKVSYI